MITLSLDGVDQIVAELQRREREYDSKSKALIKDYAGFTVDLTKQLAPVDEGFMRDHVNSKIDKNELGFSAGWFGEDFAAAGKPPYFLWVELGSAKMSAKPSLGPAWNDLEPSFLQDAGELGSIFTDG